MNLRLAWSTYRAQVQLGIHIETLSQKQIRSNILYNENIRQKLVEIFITPLP